MSISLYTGLSGLRAFETSLDVVGNNISNSNTIGYRGGRTTFGDLLSITLSGGSAPTATLGGRNPEQLGLGVAVKSIDINANAGSIIATDRNLDLTIFGPGFFVVNDGQRDLYTRAGTFGFDASGTLVDLGSGFQVRSLTNSSIVVPPTAISQPQATTSIELNGNLPATMNGPLPEILSTVNPFETGDPAEITGSNTGPFAFTDGDSFTVQVDDNPPQTVTLQTADFANIAAATAAEVAAVINTQVTGVTASVSAGAVVITSDSLGDDSSLTVSDMNGSPAIALGFSTILVTGDSQAAAATTDLNDLVTTESPYSAVDNDGITISGTLGDGTQFQGTFIYGTDGTTLGDLQTFIQGMIPDATLDLAADGSMTVTATDTGEASFALILEDAPGNVSGAANWSATQFNEDQAGTDPDTVTTAITVYDSMGEAHFVSMEFERVDALEWQLTATLPDGDGTISDGLVTAIRFNTDGTLQNAGLVGNGDANIEMQFAGVGQTIELDFGTPAGATTSGTDGITQFGGASNAHAATQNGYAAGVLADVVVTEDGVVSGLFTNGQTIAYGQIQLASFANPGGLLREGNNMFAASVNSGVALPSAGGGAGGVIQSGALESSNVDLAEEFVRMIEAQRGYQASARVIRSSEEILQSLLQNI